MEAIAKRIKGGGSKNILKKSVYGKMLRSRARMGSGGEVYLYRGKRVIVTRRQILYR